MSKVVSLFDEDSLLLFSTQPFLVSLLLTQDRKPMHGSDKAQWLLIGSVLVVLVVLRRRPWLGLMASVALELAACYGGWAPTAVIGAVVAFGSEVTRGKRDARCGRLAVFFGPLAIVAATGLVPSLLHWRASPIFRGRAHEANLATTEGILLSAALVLGQWRQALTSLTGTREKLKVAETERDAAAAGERARIARELHDVVAHQMGVVVAQAQGAEAVVSTEPDKARAALHRISSTTREALVEMRRLVDVARIDAPAATVDLDGPQPGLSLDDIARLCDRAEAAGVGHLAINYDNRRRGDGEVPAGVALAAYRVLQEAFTNAAKHAPGADVNVEVTDDASALTVEVVNGRPKRPPVDVPGSGVGLIGMRERVSLFGGTLDTGPTPDGGWRVAVTFPTLEAPTTSE